MTTVTRKQYLAAQKSLAMAEMASTKAMRAGDQTALDKANDDGAKALAIIAAYKQKGNNYSDENGNTVKAKNYAEAARKLFKNEQYPNPSGGGTLNTVYARTHKGYAEILVYQTGDKQGTFWGIEAASPQRHTLKVVQ